MSQEKVRPQKGKTKIQIVLSLKKGTKNEKDIEKTVKLKGLPGEIPKKNTPLNSSRLVKFLNLGRKNLEICGRLGKEEKGSWAQTSDLGVVSAKPTETTEHYAIIKKGAREGKKELHVPIWTNLQDLSLSTKQGTKHC